MSKERIFIIGAGGHGQEVADYMLSAGIEPEGFFDDNPDLMGKSFLGIPVIGKIMDAKKIDGKFIIAIGYNEARLKIVNNLQIPREKYFTFIHPTAIIGRKTKIGEGSTIMARSIVNVDASVGKHTIINPNAVVGHHDVIGDFVFIVGSHLGGYVKIEEGAFLGIGVSVIPSIKIGKWSVIGAGSVVIDDVPDYAVVVGNPGRIIKWRNKK
ncbi:MAG: acetyltransferase [Candidatus Heimdallarchaeaceae archaeon]